MNRCNFCSSTFQLLCINNPCVDGSPHSSPKKINNAVGGQRLLCANLSSMPWSNSRTVCHDCSFSHFLVHVPCMQMPWDSKHQVLLHPNIYSFIVSIHNVHRKYDDQDHFTLSGLAAWTLMHLLLARSPLSRTSSLLLFSSPMRIWVPSSRSKREPPVATRLRRWQHWLWSENSQAVDNAVQCTCGHLHPLSP